MSRVAFLTAARWPDLSPDDRLAAAELRAMGIAVEPVIWDAAGVDWAGYDTLLLRSTWDYPAKVPEFLAWLDAIEACSAPLWNRPATVRWNLDKRYLAELQGRGVDVVPTWYADGAEPLASILQRCGWTDAVVKPRISADAYRTFRTGQRSARADEPAFAGLAASANGAMVQRFVPEVQSDGEFSFVFLGGLYSHAVRKRPRAGDYRVQSIHGGIVEDFSPAAGLVRQAEAVLDAVPVEWLYARVDGCASEGRLLVMEVELIEPSLLLDRAPHAPRRFANVIRGITRPG